MNQQNQTGNFTQGAILGPLCRFALPVLLALLLQAAYGAADLLIVGQFSDAANISAVSTGSQIMHVFLTLAAGLAMGVTVLIGKKIGEGRPEEAGQIIGGSIGLFTLAGPGDDPAGAAAGRPLLPADERAGGRLFPDTVLCAHLRPGLPVYPGL